MVTFPFRIGNAFLNYKWHPITIPTAYYGRLEEEGLVAEDVSIASPFGSTSGSVEHGTAGYGPYYQIKMVGGQTRDPMVQFNFGQCITVELERVGKTVRITLGTA
jgi:hypothetical protein